MSFVFCFDVEDDVYQFAYAFPYSYTKLQNYLQILDNRNLDYYERELLAMSVVSLRQFFFIIAVVYIYLLIYGNYFKILAKIKFLQEIDSQKNLKVT